MAGWLDGRKMGGRLVDGRCGLVCTSVSASSYCVFMIFSLSVPVCLSVCLSVCLRLFLLLSISPLLLSFCLFLLIHFPSRFHLTPPQRRVRARVGSRATAQAGPSSTTQKQRDYSRHPSTVIPSPRTLSQSHSHHRRDDPDDTLNDCTVPLPCVGCLAGWLAGWLAGCAEMG
ncbi:uncharacterized protein IWZ02DRAFT_6096 [Phyllosticta citriasiana]|uniref:uncharacterized protein n=1 Tax=Phyllosticta citriasiana TaxID=595635 RepID=UPI0030FDDAF9